MYACDSEELPEEVKGGWFLVAQQVVERVDEIPTPRVEDVVEYFFVVVAYDLSYMALTHPDEPKPLSSRYGNSTHSRTYSSRNVNTMRLSSSWWLLKGTTSSSRELDLTKSRW